MDPAIVTIELDRSGYASCLGEQISQPAIYSSASEHPSFEVLISRMVGLSESRGPRYLTLEEQQIFEHAIRRSVRLVHKARRDA